MEEGRSSMLWWKRKHCGRKRCRQRQWRLRWGALWQRTKGEALWWLVHLDLGGRSSPVAPALVWKGGTGSASDSSGGERCRSGRGRTQLWKAGRSSNGGMWRSNVGNHHVKMKKDEESGGVATPAVSTPYFYFSTPFVFILGSSIRTPRMFVVPRCFITHC